MMHAVASGVPKTHSALPLDGKVHSLAFFRADRDLLLLSAVLLVPGLNRVGPGRESFYCKRSVVASDSEEGMADHTDVGPHPWVDVALDRDHDFLACEGLHLRRLAGGLGFVPIRVDAGHW